MARITRALDALDWRLRDLERREKRKRRSEGFWGKDELKVSPTCPPSTSINVRGGMAGNPTDFNHRGQTWMVPSLTVDLTDVNDAYQPYKFANADYYVAAVLVLGEGYNPDAAAAGLAPIWVVAYETATQLTSEWPTAAEAEDDCMDLLFDELIQVGDNAIPLCAVILRNDGQVGVLGAYMAVDAVNRGRSYLFRDVRPRGLWVQGDI